MVPHEQTREERANLILKDENAIKRIDTQRYIVKSQSGNGEYEVISSEFGLGCSCPDHAYRGLECKHILAVKFSLELREKVATQIVIPQIAIGNCAY